MTNERRVYVRRRGRMTSAQARALEHLEAYLLEDGVSLDEAFGRPGRVALEIGFGMGQALAQFAGDHPDWNCVGIDVYRPGIGSLINQIRSRGLTNVRVVEAEALDTLAALPDATLHRIMVFFPDPWPKARHHKRRLITPEFVQVAAAKLVVGGELLIATDWEPYASAIELALDASTDLEGGEVERPDLRPVTRFEARGGALGHEVRDFRYIKAPAPV